MDRYAIEDRVFLLKAYYLTGESVIGAQRKWSTMHRSRPKPSHRAIVELAEKFERIGTVEDDNTPKRERARSVRTPEVIEKALSIVEKDSSISYRELAQQIDVSKTSALRILKDDLNLFPYKIQTAQQLTDASVEKRKAFASEVCELIDDNLLDINKIIFSDEAHFWLDGYVNNQNYRIWGSEKPEVLRTKPLHPEKVTVWCGLTAANILGPFFISESITGQVYNKTLKFAILPKMRELGWLDLHWFQQDGAPPHVSHENLKLLRDNFGDRVISRKFPETFNTGLSWPPYSPDLSPLDFFLWGYVKDKIYRTAPKSIAALKKAIKETIDAVPSETLRKTIAAFEKRLRVMVVLDGRHIENVLH